MTRDRDWFVLRAAIGVIAFLVFVAIAAVVTA